MCTNVLGNLCVHRCAAVLSQDPMLCDMSAHVKNLGLEGGETSFSPRPEMQKCCFGAEKIIFVLQ